MLWSMLFCYYCLTKTQIICNWLHFLIWTQCWQTFSLSFSLRDLWSMIYNHHRQYTHDFRTLLIYMCNIVPWYLNMWLGDFKTLDAAMLLREAHRLCFHYSPIISQNSLQGLFRAGICWDYSLTHLWRVTLAQELTCNQSNRSDPKPCWST